MSTDCDVLIIGGGFAGLTAAHHLSDAGVGVVLVEARPRLGGRAHTVHGPGQHVIECGAEFVHGHAPELERMIRRAGLEVEEVPDRHWLPERGAVREVDFEAVWQPIAQRLAAHTGPDESFAQFMLRQQADLKPWQHDLIRSYVEGFNAADLRDVSVAWLRQCEQTVGAGGGEMGRLKKGYSALVDWMVSELAQRNVPIMTEAPVKRIEWQPGSVTVQVGREVRTLRAERLICTASLSVLQSDREIRFSPAIEEKLSLARRLKMGMVVKLALLFRERLWPVEEGFLHTPNEIVQTWWTALEPLQLTGWVGGPSAHFLVGRERAAVIDLALGSLARSLVISKRKLEEALTGWHVFDWQTDPYCRGAYMYVPVGQRAVPDELAQPLAETLYFAGEATEVGLAGTTAGAMASGARAAELVLHDRNHERAGSPMHMLHV